MDDPGPYQIKLTAKREEEEGKGGGGLNACMRLDLNPSIVALVP